MRRQLWFFQKGAVTLHMIIVVCFERQTKMNRRDSSTLNAGTKNIMTIRKAESIGTLCLCCLGYIETHAMLSRRGWGAIFCLFFVSDNIT